MNSPSQAKAPGMAYITQVACEVGPIVSLGPAPLGERRVVDLLGGTVVGPQLNGRIVAGGTDWQWSRSDGALDIHAHYQIETHDGARIEVQSLGVRHGPPEVIARLLRGESVAPNEYYFRTALRFTTGSPAYAHFNTMLGVAQGRREARLVVLDFWQVL